MKKVILLGLSLCSMTAAAQDPYLNNSIINTSDVLGTARFVGMGGAMGALGADISVISSNPAGIGMFTKNNISLTAGASWLGNNSARGMAKGTFAQFDQVGVVTSFKLPGRVSNLNFGFNYQKKASYDNSFFGETLTAASWADQLDALAQEAWDNRNYLYSDDETYYNTLYGLANGCGVFPWLMKDNSRTNIAKNPSDPSSTLQVTRGSLNAYEFNLSMNLADQFFFGLTVGVDNVDWRRGTDYWEQRTGTNGTIHDFGYRNEQIVTGNGYNLKFGAIVRPFDASTFRVGLTVESPTWYSLKYVDDQILTTKYRYDENKKEYVYESAQDKYNPHSVYSLSDSYINYLEYHLTTPWKVRAQIGSTVGTRFAWGMEYEFANYPGTTMKYPSRYGGYNYADEGFMDMTKEILKAQHTVRAGLELKPISSVSLRAGYNFITSSTSQNGEWDPFFSDDALAYPTGVDYMNLSDVHIATLGVGYRYKWLYADISYKYRYQRGDYYAFNQAYSQALLGVDSNTSIMDPIAVNLDRHSIMATIGARF